MAHRLVAEAFVPNPNGYTIVDHINRDKPDNRAENFSRLGKTLVVDGQFYSRISGHCIPQFKDEDGVYVFVSNNNGGYTKTYI